MRILYALPAGIEINNCARMSLMLRRAPSAAWLTEEWQEKMKMIEGLPELRTVYEEMSVRAEYAGTSEEELRGLQNIPVRLPFRIQNKIITECSRKKEKKMAFEEVKISELQFNPFDKISKQWMLITAGESSGECNTMTASWGGVGIMWGKPGGNGLYPSQRYTKEFVDKNEYFTLSFLPEAYRKALNVCGSVSGRDVEDKWQEAGLHPVEIDGTTAVEEAEEIFVCRKLYAQDMVPECFTDGGECDEKWYPDKDYHTMYMAEIVKVLRRKHEDQFILPHLPDQYAGSPGEPV